MDLIQRRYLLVSKGGVLDFHLVPLLARFGKSLCRRRVLDEQPINLLERKTLRLGIKQPDYRLSGRYKLANPGRPTNGQLYECHDDENDVEFPAQVGNSNRSDLDCHKCKSPVRKRCKIVSTHPWKTFASYHLVHHQHVDTVPVQALDHRPKPWHSCQYGQCSRRICQAYVESQLHPNATIMAHVAPKATQSWVWPPFFTIII
jgi:hypothetical protein